MTLYGNPVLVSVSVVDSSGAAADPATLTVTVYRPDNGSDTFTIGQLTHGGTGAYSLSYTPTVVGTHRWTAVATVPSFASEGTFTVTALAGAMVGAKLPSGYLTVAEFRNMATYLEFDNLVQGGSQGQNSEELANELRRASGWVDDYLNGPTLGATLHTEQDRARIDRDGMLNLRPHATSGKIPVRSLVSLAYGAGPSLLTSLTDLSGLWQDGATLSIPISSYTGTWSGALQFNTGYPNADLFVRYSYISGWPSTVLTADTTVGATTITVADATGILAGDVLTIVDPGDPASADTSSEQVTVASVSSDTVTLTTALVNAHTAANQIGVSAVPDSLKKAVAFVARSFLGRRGPEKQKPTFGGSRVPAAVKTAQDEVIAADEFLTDAAAILEPYRRKTP